MFLADGDVGDYNDLKNGTVEDYINKIKYKEYKASSAKQSTPGHKKSPGKNRRTK